MIYADVIIDISHEKLGKDFQYRVPEELVQAIKPGVVVTVPFGKGNTLRKGYVTGISERQNMMHQSSRRSGSVHRQ